LAKILSNVYNRHEPQIEKKSVSRGHQAKKKKSVSTNLVNLCSSSNSTSLGKDVGLSVKTPQILAKGRHLVNNVFYNYNLHNSITPRV